MKILVINCGSSSLKYQLFDMESEKWLAKGICEAIGTSTSSAKGSDNAVISVIKTTGSWL